MMALRQLLGVTCLALHLLIFPVGVYGISGHSGELHIKPQDPSWNSTDHISSGVSTAVTPLTRSISSSEGLWAPHTTPSGVKLIQKPDAVLFERPRPLDSMLFQSLPPFHVSVPGDPANLSTNTLLSSSRATFIPTRAGSLSSTEQFVGGGSAGRGGSTASRSISASVSASIDQLRILRPTDGTPGRVLASGRNQSSTLTWFTSSPIANIALASFIQTKSSGSATETRKNVSASHNSIAAASETGESPRLVEFLDSIKNRTENRTRSHPWLGPRPIGFRPVCLPPSKLEHGSYAISGSATQKPPSAAVTGSNRTSSTKFNLIPSGTGESWALRQFLASIRNRTESRKLERLKAHEPSVGLSLYGFNSSIPNRTGHYLGAITGGQYPTNCSGVVTSTANIVYELVTSTILVNETITLGPNATTPLPIFITPPPACQTITASCEGVYCPSTSPLPIFPPIIGPHPKQPARPVTEPPINYSPFAPLTATSTLLVTKKSPAIVQQLSAVGNLFGPSSPPPAVATQPNADGQQATGQNSGSSNPDMSTQSDDSDQSESDSDGQSPEKSTSQQNPTNGNSAPASSNSQSPDSQKPGAGSSGGQSSGSDDQTASNVGQPNGAASNNGATLNHGASSRNGDTSGNGGSSSNAGTSNSGSTNTGESSSGNGRATNDGDAANHEGASSNGGASTNGDTSGNGGSSSNVGTSNNENTNTGEDSSDNGKATNDGGAANHEGTSSNGGASNTGGGGTSNGDERPNSAGTSNDGNPSSNEYQSSSKGGAPTAGDVSSNGAASSNGESSSNEGVPEPGVGDSADAHGMQYVPSVVMAGDVPISIASNAVIVGSHTVNAGSSPTTVVTNGQTVVIQSSHIVAQGETIPIQAAVTPAPANYATIGNVPVVLRPQNVAIGSKTFEHGSSPTSVIYNGQTYSWDASHLVVGAGATIAFPSAGSTVPQVTAGGHVFSVYPSQLKASGRDIILPTTAKASPFVYKGQTFSVNPSQIIAPDTSITLPLANKVTPFIYIDHSLSVDASQFMARSTTIPLSSGSGTVTYNGQILTIKPSEVIGPSTTVALSAPDNSGASPTVVTTGGLTFSIGPSAAIVGSSTYSFVPGKAPATIMTHGEAVLVGPNGVQFGNVHVPIPTKSPTFSAITQGDLTFSVAPSKVVVGSHTDDIRSDMTPITTIIDGHTISIGPNGVGLASTTVPLPTPKPSFSMATEGDLTFSVAPSEVVVQGKTYSIIPHKAPITTDIDGHMITIGPKGIHIEGTTVNLPVIQTPTGVILGGLTFSVGATDAVISGTTYAIGNGAPLQTAVVGSQTIEMGSAGVMFPSITIVPEQTPTAVTADGLTFSVGSGEAVINGTTYAIGSGAVGKTIAEGSKTVILGTDGVILPSTTIRPWSSAGFSSVLGTSGASSAATAVGPLIPIATGKSGDRQHAAGVSTRVVNSNTLLGLVLGVLMQGLRLI